MPGSAGPSGAAAPGGHPAGEASPERVLSADVERTAIATVGPLASAGLPSAAIAAAPHASAGQHGGDARQRDRVEPLNPEIPQIAVVEEVRIEVEVMVETGGEPSAPGLPEPTDEALVPPDRRPAAATTSEGSRGEGAPTPREASLRPRFGDQGPGGPRPRPQGRDRGPLPRPGDRRPPEPRPPLLDDSQAPDQAAPAGPNGGPGPMAGMASARAASTCTGPQLKRFIKSRVYVPMHELRRRFQIDGHDDDVSVVTVGSDRVYLGLPEREGRLLGELLRGGDVGYELSLDPPTPIVVGVYPMRPISRG